jgi:phage tail-like protein
MIKKMKRDVKYVSFGVLIFALAMGFTFANYESANAAGREDPLVGFSYALDIQGVVKGYFTEAYNIGSEHEVIEHKVVDSKGKETVMKIPGRLRWFDFTLKRGITSNNDLQIWRQQVVDGKVDISRKDGSIVMYDQSFKEVARWNFTRGWPSKLISNPVDMSATGTSNRMAIESVTITGESIRRVK